MAPTIQNGVEQKTVDVQSIKREHSKHRHPTNILDIWRRQHRSEAPQQPVSPGTQVDDDTYEAYTSPIPLHANITPVIMPTSQGSPGLGHLSATEVILISGGTLIAVGLGLVALFMMRSIVAKKTRRFLVCCQRRNARKSTDISEDKSVLVTDEDDPTWGTPPRFVYVEGINSRHEAHHQLADPFLSPDSPSFSSPTCILQSHLQPKFSATREEEQFQDRLKDEENDITLALDRAFRGVSGEATETVDSTRSLASTSTQDEIFSSPDLDNVPTRKSLIFSLHNPGKDTVPTIVNRPRQGSDASTTSTGPDIVDCFSIMSPDSSATSLGSSDSCIDREEPEELDIVYEVRRAHAQSIELKRGVLVTCRRASSGASESSVSCSVPTFVISETAPSLLPLDDQNFAPLFSLKNSTSSKASLFSYAATTSLSSMIRENSRGTIASLSTSFSAAQTEGWYHDHEQRLQPPVPFLVLTRPSDSSIYTSDSSSSSVSVDLCDFPLPPVPPKSSYCPNFVDKVKLPPKRTWDNHSADSSVAQKRSTVERFIMMYSTA